LRRQRFQTSCCDKYFGKLNFFKGQALSVKVSVDCIAELSKIVGEYT
jgi:hypothetical protein